MHLLKRDEIDVKLWDSVIARCPSGLPYGFSQILDVCTDKQWMGIVSEDYQWVMPLPYNRKLLGFRQFYQPYLLQQLGIFGRIPDAIEVEEVFRIIKKNSKRGIFAFQENNSSFVAPYSLAKTNIILDVDRSYQEIQQGYHKALRRRLNKDYDDQWLQSDDLKLEDILDLYMEHTYKLYGANEKMTQQYIRAFVQTCYDMGLIKLLALKAPDSVIYSGYIIIVTKSRVIKALSFNNVLYKHYSGPTRLIDNTIQKYAGKPFIIDFAGSEIKSVAEFYKPFNPTVRPYFIVKT